MRVSGLQEVHREIAGEGRDKMRARDTLEKGAVAVDTIIQNLAMVVGTMESLGELSAEVVAAAGDLK